MSKWLAPSSINFLKMHRDLIVGDDSPVNELSRRLDPQEVSKVPKMQVSEKDGHMFALNNSSLQLMRQLEKQGKLQRGLIQVEMVPLSKVPANIQMAMKADIESTSALSTIDPEQPDCSNNIVRDKLNSEGHHKTCVSQVVNQTNSDEEEDEDEDDDEADEEASNGSSTSDDTMQCNVCDRTFSTAKLLAAHQLKKKHIGCSVCDTVFPSLIALEQHKNILDHWSDEDNPLPDDDNDERNFTYKPQREKIERLL